MLSKWPILGVPVIGEMLISSKKSFITSTTDRDYRQRANKLLQTLNSLQNSLIVQTQTERSAFGILGPLKFINFVWIWIASTYYLPVWPDWTIFCTLGLFLKPLATINLPESSTFLGNFCKGVKIYQFSSETIFGQLL